MTMPTTRLEDLSFPVRDERFGQVIERLSEVTSAPAGDNFVSNEDSYTRVAGELARRAPRGGVYLGVGPDQNFTMIARAKPPLAIIADYRRRNLLVHLLHKALFMLSGDRLRYLTRLTARKVEPGVEAPTGQALATTFQKAKFDREILDRVTAEVIALLRPLEVVRDEEWGELGTIQARIAGPGVDARFLALPMYPTLGTMMGQGDREGRPAHFLASEGTYHSIRTLQWTDRVIPVVADLAGPRALVRIGDWLREIGLKVGVFYVSDVEFFLLRASRFDDYARNLRALPWEEKGLIVRSSTREIEHPARVAGDTGTTLVVEARAFLEDAARGRVKSPEDLFR